MGTEVTSRGAGASPGPLLDDLAAAGFEIGHASRVTTTVLDTFDARLHEAGLRLEHRDHTIVLRGPGATAATLHVEAAPRFASDLPPGPFRNRLVAVTEIRALLPVATMSTVVRRATRRNRDDKVVASVAVHDAITIDDRRIEGWLAEVDELTGYGKQAGAASEVVLAHVVDPVPLDALDALLTAEGVVRTGRHVEPGVPLDPALAALEGFRLVLANLDDAIETNRPGTLDDLDPEFLHDLRVAVRRTRSVLRHGRDVLPPDVLAWAEPGFKRVGDVTSPPRDLDVQVIEWQGHVDGLDDASVLALEPLRRQLLADRAAAHEVLATELAGADVTDLLRRWHDTVHRPLDPAAAGPDGALQIGSVVRHRIEKAQHRLVANGRAITPDTPADHVHEVRKDAKKLRYLLECFAGLVPADGRKAFVKRLKRLQDILGEHQDAEVQVDQLRTAADELPAATSPATYLAVGQLIAELERTRQAARDQFAERFAEYDSAPTRLLLLELLEAVDP